MLDILLSHAGSKALCEQAEKLVNAFSNESFCGLTQILGFWIAESWIRFLLMEKKNGVPIKKCLAERLAKNSTSVKALIPSPCTVINVMLFMV